MEGWGWSNGRNLRGALGEKGAPENWCPFIPEAAKGSSWLVPCRKEDY